MTGRLAELLSVASIIAISVAVALLWVFRVPVFQQPDENMHADYAFSIFGTGRLIRASEGRPTIDAAPTTRYLEKASGFRLMRYNLAGRALPGYGSAPFYRDVDANAPHVPADFIARDHEVPNLVGEYPFLYYGLDALAIGLGSVVTRGSLSGEFFFARGLSVVLLALSLCFVYGTMRELNLKLRQRLALLAIVGLLPLTVWVSAYVQPDDLGFTAVAMVLYFATRVGHAPSDPRRLAVLGLALGILWLTKVQYFAATAPVAMAASLTAARPYWRSRGYWLTALPTLVLPTTVAWFAGHAITLGATGMTQSFLGGFGGGFRAALSGGPHVIWPFVWSELWSFYIHTFVWGIGLFTYWSGFGWLPSPIFRGRFGLNPLLWSTISMLSLVVSVAMIVRMLNVLRRIGRIAVRRSPLTSLRILTSDVVLNSYFVYIFILAIVFVLSTGQLGEFGRYWLPFQLATVFCAVRYAPQLLPRRFAAAASALMILLLLGYSIATAVAAPWTLQARFYDPPDFRVHNEERMAFIDRLDGVLIPQQILQTRTLRVPERTTQFGGWAVDSRSGEPAVRVDLVVDEGTRFPTQYGLLSCNRLLEIPFWDPELYRCGFSASVDLSKLGPGEHVLSLLIYERTRATPYPSAEKMRIFIPPPGGKLSTPGG